MRQHESVRFMMAHKKNLLALGEAVERAHLIANVDLLHNPVLDSDNVQISISIRIRIWNGFSRY